MLNYPLSLSLSTSTIIMTTKYERYRAADQSLPDKAAAWNMYGAGLENIGREGHPEWAAVPRPSADQLLVRIDSVGLCFSDLKIIKQGGQHPKLYQRDLSKTPTRLGHEVSLTIVEVGEHLRDRFQPGQRYAVQPDIYQQGKSMAYGYTVPGGLVQYHLIGAEVLESDEGACLLRLDDSMGYAESALLEPWGCVMAAYTQRRRLWPKAGGVMWVIGRRDDDTAYTFSAGLEGVSTLILTDAPDSVQRLAHDLAARTQCRVLTRDGILGADVGAMAAALANEFTLGQGFDDIIMLDPRSAKAVGAVARWVARRGILNLVGRTPLDGLVDADVGRLHYDYIAFVGGHGPDIAASYGEARNRCELREDGCMVLIGAGGPMGQMHLQRAIEHPHGPKTIIATELSVARVENLKQRFGGLAEQHQCHLLVVNPNQAGQSLREAVMAHSQQRGADDVVVCAPSAEIMAEGAALMAPDGMLILFAGVPNGTLAPLNVSDVYLGNAQFTGTSGLTIRDQALVMESAVQKTLSPGRSVAAIGGMGVALNGIEALMEGRFPGKIVIFPQLLDVPLLGLDQLHTHLPQVAEKLGPDYSWTLAAEAALLETAWPH